MLDRKNNFIFTPACHQTDSSKGFTLLELLIVIAILAIITTVVVMVLNPAEYLAQARDTKRSVDMANINKALQMYDFDNPGVLAQQSSAIVYISLPDATSTCTSYTLPTLPTGYIYHCVTEANLRKTDGTGWIPVNFTTISGGSPLSSLPTDPTNSATNRTYYSYVQGGSWELVTPMESTLYKMGGGKDLTSTDKGKYTGLYETGTSYTLMPMDYGDSSLVAYWPMDEGTGGIVYDHAGNNKTISLYNTTWTTGKVGNALSFDGVSSYGYASNTGQFDLTSTNVVTVSFWLNWNTFSDDNMVAFEFGNYNVYNDGFTVVPNSSVVPGKFRPCLLGNVGYNCSYFTRPAAQEWHHYVFIYDKSKSGATELIPYVDGSLVSYLKDFSSDNTNNFGLRYIYFMSRTGTSNFGKGIMDDVKIYKKALTAAEVSALYNATK